MGKGEWNNQNLAFAVWGDDPLTEMIDGLEGGDSLVLKIWDKESTEELEAEVTYTGNNSEYTQNALYIVNSLYASGDGIITPESSALVQNYPNPVNSENATITYEISETTPVTIDIYDLLGHRIKSLVSETKDPGQYNLEWDLTNESGYQVKNGIYICLMQKSGSRNSTKIIVAK